MKILFLSHRFSPDIGGIEVNSDILATNFSQLGHDIRLATWTEQEACDDRPFTIYRKPTLLTLIKLHFWADIVFENNPCLRLSWPALLLRKKRVIALRTWVCRIDGRKGWQDLLKLLIIRTATGVIAVSDAVRARTYPSAVVIGNPYREELFRINDSSAQRAGFVFLGRLVSDKGLDLGFQALHQLLAEDQCSMSDLRITVIGDGPEMDNLIKLAHKLDLDKQIIFSGSLRGVELVNELNRHRYLLVPSLWEEPFGNVALEGMACGCIPIVSDGGGLPDAVGAAGIVFPKGNVIALTRAMKELLTNAPLNQCLRQEGSLHLKNHHPKTISQRYLDVIQSSYYQL